MTEYPTGAPAVTIRSGDCITVNLAGLLVAGEVIFAENAGTAGAPQWIIVMRFPDGRRWAWDQGRLGGEVFHNRNGGKYEPRPERIGSQR